ncbi:MAG: DNA adenine methylase [Chloroflexota bacterium]|nr:DNA adenine methylase [Chloroflexota bacterium]
MPKVRKVAEQKTAFSYTQSSPTEIGSKYIDGPKSNLIYVRRKKSVPPPISRLRKKKVIAFGWYGGKFSHLDWLLPLLPPCHHYCEPFGGSGAVLLNRPPSPVETYNDLDGEVANFFRVLREDKEKLIEAIGLTPFSREEFGIACIVDPEQNLLERARRFFVRARQVRTGLAQTASLGRWANCKNTSRAGMSGVISRWLGSIEDLPEIAERLLRVQIENRPALAVIRLYDSPDTLFYCDPPYVHLTRGDNSSYGYEMTDDEHRDLAKVLNSIQGRVAISNYQCELMDELYPVSKWIKTVTAEKTIHSTKGKRIEALWTNYDPHTQGKGMRRLLERRHG